MVLHLGVENSGMGSLVHDEGGRQVEVPVTTIDLLVRELGLPRVDFIKIDIEGAEREALQGGMQTLRRHRPRLMLDSYHEPDDMIVLPGVIRQAHAGYKVTCGPASLDPRIPRFWFRIRPSTDNSRPASILTGYGGLAADRARKVKVYLDILRGPNPSDKRWAEGGHRAHRHDGEALDWALGETWAKRMGVTSVHPRGDGGWVEWTMEEEDSQTLPHRISPAD